MNHSVRHHYSDTCDLAITIDDLQCLDFRARDIGTYRIGQFELFGRFYDSLSLDFRSRDIGTCRIGQFLCSIFYSWQIMKLFSKMRIYESYNSI